jgi:hypothetical protein
MGLAKRHSHGLVNGPEHKASFARRLYGNAHDITTGDGPRLPVSRFFGRDRRMTRFEIAYVRYRTDTRLWSE